MGSETGTTDRLGIDSNVAVRRLGLNIRNDISLPVWQRVGRQLSVLADSSAWCLGDWLVYGERHFPQRYRQAITETKLDYQTLRNYAWVARRIPLSRRRDNLSFAHHMETAALSPQDQDLWLDRADVHGWTRNALRRHLRRSRDESTDRICHEVHVKVVVTADQEALWRKAAERVESQLEEWAASVLDNAAKRELTRRHPAELR